MPKPVRKNAKRAIARTPRSTAVSIPARVSLKPSAALNRKISGLKLSSVSGAAREVRALKLTKAHIAPALQSQFNVSEKKAVNFSRGLMTHWNNSRETAEQSAQLVAWGRQGAKQRKMMVRAFRQSKRGLNLVHNIGLLSLKDAKPFMKDYFAEGGSEDEIAEWMAEAGKALAEAELNERLGTDGLWSWAKKTVSSIGKAIKTVGDAVVSAGKNLAKSIAKVAGWTASKIKDFVKGIIKAGKSVASILAEAAKKGLSTLKKFIKGVLDAGRKIGEIIAWAASQASKTLRDTLSEILRLGRKLVDIIGDAAARGLTILKKTIKALLDLGKRVRDILKEAVRKGTQVLLNTVKALLAAGKKIADVLLDAAGATFDLLKKTISALIKAGKKVADILREAFRKGAALMKKAVDALLKLGRSVASVISEAIKKGVTIVKETVRALISLGKSIIALVSDAVRRSVNFLNNVVKALISLGKKLADILRAVIRKGLARIQKVINAIKAAGRKMAEVLKEVAKKTGKILKELVAATFKAFRKIGEILETFAKRTVSIIRTVLEGLFLAGVTLGKSIVGIVKGVAEKFREGFFKGLIALGKAPLKIFEEALKAGLSIAALTLAALLEAFGGHRPLTAEESKQARRLYGSSINLKRVKVAVSSAPADLINKVNGARPFTTMYVLNFASWKKVNIKTLMHELAHTWQAATVGPVYMIEALHAQFKEGPDAYKVTDDMLRNNGNNLDKFNREQQAVIAEEYWFERWGKTDYPRLSGRGLDVKLLRPYALQMHTPIRSPRPFNRSFPIFNSRLKLAKPLQLKIS